MSIFILFFKLYVREKRRLTFQQQYLQIYAVFTVTITVTSSQQLDNIQNANCFIGQVVTLQMLEVLSCRDDFVHIVRNSSVFY